MRNSPQLLLLSSVVCLLVVATQALAANEYARLDERGQQRVVKLYGAGGLRGLESQQTGLLVSSDGLAMTAATALLESGEATVVTSVGDRYTGTVEAVDRLTGIALIKIESSEQSLPFFDLEVAREPRVAERVWALSNAFGIAAGHESASVQQGVVSGVAALDAAGPFTAPPGLREVLVIDAIVSNPGATGGAVVDSQGELLGMIGRETRSRATGGWINHALPTRVLRDTLVRMLSGLRNEDAEATEATADPYTARARVAAAGIVLVPAINQQTPAYVEQVPEDSPAWLAGLRADDLIVAVGGRTAPAVWEAPQQMLAASREGRVALTVLRDKEIVEIEAPMEVSP